jgi:hypothetical protein
MSTGQHSVAIVVDRAFGDRLIELAGRLHVWIVDSPVNRPVQKRVWEASPHYVLETGATIVFDDGMQAPDVVAERMLDDVEQHHGEGAHAPPLTRLEVYGARCTPLLQAALEEFDYDHFEDTPDGFLATRPDLYAG